MLAIATNIPVLLMTAFVLQGHILLLSYYNNNQLKIKSAAVYTQIHINQTQPWCIILENCSNTEWNAVHDNTNAKLNIFRINNQPAAGVYA